LIIAIFIFELGSLICAVAPTSYALIAGRAIAGVGCAGITSGTYIVIGHIIPMRIRPICISTIAIVFAVAAVLGPVLGGIFTTHLTWRWCFYINLPFGGFTIGTLVLFLPSLKRATIEDCPLKEKLKKIDLVGLSIYIPAIVCLLLALQWGGSTYPWNDGRIIALFVLFGVLSIVFILFEQWKGAEATLPMHVITQRSVAAAAWNAFCNGAAFFLLIFYIPFWLQAIRNDSAASSGIELLPFVLSVVVMANLVGFLVTKFGYCRSIRALKECFRTGASLTFSIADAPFMIGASIISPIGEGLMTTWTADTPFSHWVGYQALTGLGIGMGQQQTQVAIQAVLPKEDIPAGASIVVLLQTLSGAIFIAIGQAVLQNKFAANLNAAFPDGGVDIGRLLEASASELRTLVSAANVDLVLRAYNGALTRIFLVAAIMSALTVVGSLLIEWKSVKKAKKQR
jgi:MFS family permease